MAEIINSEPAGKDVIEAIRNSQQLMPEYWNKCLESRVDDNGIGSNFGDTYKGEPDPKGALEMDLTDATWYEAKHPDVLPFCRSFVTYDLEGGKNGLMQIAALPDDTLFVAQDPKETGKISIATMPHGQFQKAHETWMIVGPADKGDVQNEQDAGKPVVYTFHPGEPVRPSPVPVKDIPDGTVLTKAQVQALGFNLAKADRNTAEIIRAFAKEHDIDVRDQLQEEPATESPWKVASGIMSDPTAASPEFTPTVKDLIAGNGDEH